MNVMNITPDEQMRKEMAAWPDDSRDFTYTAGMDLSKDVGLGITMRPTIEGTYFPVFTFAASVDVRRPLWDPNFKPASKPSMKEKGKESDQDSSSE
jgi:hypothetical protein